MPSKVVLKMAEGGFREKVFIAGFHGFGFVGYLTARHLVKVLKGVRIGYVISPFMPQVVSTCSEGIATPYELYDTGSAVVFLPNAPLTRNDVFRVPYALAEASFTGGARMAILVGGLDASFRGGEGVLRYAATRSFLARYGYLVKGELPLEEGLSIVGPLAAMLAYYEANNFPSVAILPYTDPSTADPLAAKTAVDFIAKILDVQVDSSELLKLAEEKVRLEKELELLKSKAEQEGGKPKVPTFYV